MKRAVKRQSVGLKEPWKQRYTRTWRRMMAPILLLNTLGNCQINRTPSAWSNSPTVYAECVIVIILPRPFDGGGSLINMGSSHFSIYHAGKPLWLNTETCRKFAWANFHMFAQSGKKNKKKNRLSKFKRHQTAEKELGDFTGRFSQSAPGDEVQYVLKMKSLLDLSGTCCKGRFKT